MAENNGKPEGKEPRVLKIKEIGADKPPETKKREDSHGAGKAAAFAASAVLLAGCEYVTNNYYGPDADNADATTEDAPTTDATTCDPFHVSDRCSEDSPTSARCMVYEGTALSFDGYLFVPRVRTESGITMVDVDVRDPLLDCEAILTSSLSPGSTSMFTLGETSYTATANIVLPSTIHVPLIDLEISKTEESAPTCPETTDRCTAEGLDLSCTVYDGKAVEVDGYLFKLSNMDAEAGVLDVTVMDKELDCETTNSARARIGEPVYFMQQGKQYIITVNSMDSWVSPFANVTITRPPGSACAEPSELCEETYDGIRCRVNQDHGLLADGYLFIPRNIRMEGGFIRLDLDLQDAEGCITITSETVINNGNPASIVIAGREYTILFHNAFVGSGPDSWADLEVRIPPINECDESITTERCERTSNSVRCDVHEGQTIVLDGYYFLVRNMREDGGERRLAVLVFDGEASCIPIANLDMPVPVDHDSSGALEVGSSLYRITVHNMLLPGEVFADPTASADFEITRDHYPCGLSSDSRAVLYVGDALASSDGRIRLVFVGRSEDDPTILHLQVFDGSGSFLMHDMLIGEGTNNLIWVEGIPYLLKYRGSGTDWLDMSIISC